MKKLSMLLILALLLTGCAQEPPVTGAATVPPTAPVAETTLPTEGEGLILAKITSRYAEEEIPSLNEDGLIMEERETDLFSVRYLRTAENTLHYLGANAFEICLDPPLMNSGNHIGVYLLDENGLTMAPELSVSKEYLLDGNLIRTSYEYAVYADNKTHLNRVSQDSNVWFLQADRLDRWLVYFPYSVEDGVTVDYPALMDPRTGTLTDFLAPLGKEAVLDALQYEVRTRGGVMGLNRTILSENGCLLASLNSGGHLYFDVPDGKIWDLDELCGRELSDCAVLRDWSRFICWDAEGNVWVISEETMEPRLTLEEAEIEFARGIRSGNLGCSFLLYWEDGDLRCLDFQEQCASPMEDLSGWPIDGQMGTVSPDGRSYACFFPNTEGGRPQFWIFDCDSMTLCHLLLREPEGMDFRHAWWSADNRLYLQEEEGRMCCVFDFWEEGKPLSSVREE